MSEKSVNIGLDLLYNPHKVKCQTMADTKLTFEKELHMFYEQMLKKYPQNRIEIENIMHLHKTDKQSQTESDT